MSLSLDYKHIQIEILALQKLPPPSECILPPSQRSLRPVQMLSEVDATQWIGCATELLALYVEGKFVAVLDHLLTQRLLGISDKVGLDLNYTYTQIMASPKRLIISIGAKYGYLGAPPGYTIYLI